MARWLYWICSYEALGELRVLDISHEVARRRIKTFRELREFRSN